ncbi:Ubiquinone biosynthesis O-methyltransferase [subsurface metagenome]
MSKSPGVEEMKGKLDLEWDDGHVVPEVVNPEVEFLFRRMIEATREAVNPRQGEKILDIGCGRATDGVELAKKGAMVIGLEPSKVMIAHARRHIAENGADMAVIHGAGEYLPFRPQSMDKVVCKGALDHFLDPVKVISQIALVLKPEGKAVISIANFESLGFKLGKGVCRFRKLLGFKDGEGKLPWEIPVDHTVKFDYHLVRRLVNKDFEVEQGIGVSLLFGVPWWGTFLSKCSPGMSRAILNTLDKVARHVPSLSDVVVLRCRPKNGGKRSLSQSSTS